MGLEVAHQEAGRQVRGACGDDHPEEHRAEDARGPGAGPGGTPASRTRTLMNKNTAAAAGLANRVRKACSRAMCAVMAALWGLPAHPRDAQLVRLTVPGPGMAATAMAASALPIAAPGAARVVDSRAPLATTMMRHHEHGALGVRQDGRRDAPQ